MFSHIPSFIQCLSPAGEYNLRLGIMKELQPDMVATYAGRLDLLLVWNAWSNYYILWETKFETHLHLSAFLVDYRCSILFHISNKAFALYFIASYFVLAPKYLKAIHSLLKLELAWVERTLSKYKFFMFALLILYLYVPACILLLMKEHEELNF